MLENQLKLIQATQDLYWQFIQKEEYAKAVSVAGALKNLCESNKYLHEALNLHEQQQKVHKPQVEVQQPMQQQVPQIAASTYVWGDGWQGKESVENIANPWGQ